MKNRVAERKLITFFDTESEHERVQNEINQGWILASLIVDGKNFIGLLEQAQPAVPDNELVVRIPPRKKIKITF